MLSLFFHHWERRLADVSKDRIVRPFEWGLDWLPPGANGHHADPHRGKRQRSLEARHGGEQLRVGEFLRAGIVPERVLQLRHRSCADR